MVMKYYNWKTQLANELIELNDIKDNKEKVKGNEKGNMITQKHNMKEIIHVNDKK